MIFLHLANFWRDSKAFSTVCGVMSYADDTYDWLPFTFVVTQYVLITLFYLLKSQCRNTPNHSVGIHPTATQVSLKPHYSAVHLMS